MVSLAHVRRASALLAVAGAAVLGIGVAQVIASASASAATGSNFVATGHDMDFHCNSGDTDECAYLKIVTDVVRSGSTKPILAVDHGTELPSALAKAGETPVTTVDPDDATAFNAVKFTGPGNAPLFSAIIVASDATCGGCDNDPTGEANINARAKDFKTFFNNGGGILALAGADNRDTYYKFVPLSDVTAEAVSAPFTVTPAGAKLKITTAMANCCATHNSFALPKSPLVALETDSAGLAETIAGLNVKIGGGGFTSSASSTVASTTASSAPPTTSAAPSSVAATSTAALAVTGPNARHGGVRVMVVVGFGLLLGGGLLLILGQRRPKRAR